MPFSFNEVGTKGEGDTITIPFPYIHEDHIFVRVDGVVVSTTLYEFSSASTLLCSAGFPEGDVTRVERVTPPDELPAAQQGSGVFDWRGANKNDTHLLYIAQERSDLEATVIESAGQVAADLAESLALSVGLLAASDEATAAAVTATTKASEASASAATASTDASTATTGASTATTKAAEAAASANAASISAGDLEAAKDAFEALGYLGDWGPITEAVGASNDYGSITA